MPEETKKEEAKEPTTIKSATAKIWKELLRKLTSTTRLALIALLALSLWRWAHGEDIPASMQTILMSLLGALLGGKLTHAIRSKVEGCDDGVPK